MTYWIPIGSQTLVSTPESSWQVCGGLYPSFALVSKESGCVKSMQSYKDASVNAIGNLRASRPFAGKVNGPGLAEIME